MGNIGTTVPWNASWTAEDRFEIRPCKYADNELAMWQPFAPGQGKPIFAKPHFVRQRRSIAEFRCTVCGAVTPADDRWTFGHGEHAEGVFRTQEAPVHEACADLAMKLCPRIREQGIDPFPFPGGWRVVASILGGPKVLEDFGVHVGHRRVIGALKFEWDMKS